MSVHVNVNLTVPSEDFEDPDHPQPSALSEGEERTALLSQFDGETAYEVINQAVKLKKGHFFDKKKLLAFPLAVWSCPC